MQRPDLNLLYSLHVLLNEGSVAGAARKLNLSPSAMSRTLARLRDITSDELLVRAGRGLVPTPRAMELHQKVGSILEDAQVLLRPTDQLDLATLKRAYTLRTSDGFTETFGPSLMQRVRQEAPHIQLNFVRKLDKSSAGLRDGTIDLETGVVEGTIGPEVRAQALFSDSYVGAVRQDHPLVQQEVSAEQYTAWPHVLAWREGLNTGSIDHSLGALGLKRDIMTIVDGFSAALALARGSELIATVPEKHTAGLLHGMHTFALPLPINTFTLSLLWHPRLDGDAAHKWLRKCVFETCRAA